MEIKNINKKDVKQCLDKQVPFNLKTKDGAITFIPATKRENPMNFECFGANGFPEMIVEIKDNEPHWKTKDGLIRWFE